MNESLMWLNHPWSYMQIPPFLWQFALSWKKVKTNCTYAIYKSDDSYPVCTSLFLSWHTPNWIHAKVWISQVWYISLLILADMQNSDCTIPYMTIKTNNAKNIASSLLFFWQNSSLMPSFHKNAPARIELTQLIGIIKQLVNGAYPCCKYDQWQVFEKTQFFLLWIYMAFVSYFLFAIVNNAAIFSYQQETLQSLYLYLAMCIIFHYLTSFSWHFIV